MIGETTAPQLLGAALAIINGPRLIKDPEQYFGAAALDLLVAIEEKYSIKQAAEEVAAALVLLLEMEG